MKLKGLEVKHLETNMNKTQFYEYFPTFETKEESEAIVSSSKEGKPTVAQDYQLTYDREVGDYTT